MKHYSFFTKSQMINLLKPLAFIFGSAVFLGVSAFSIHQYETINHQSKTIQHQHDKITSLRANYLDKNYLQDELVEENNILKATIVELRDSISNLHAEIFNLQTIIQAQNQKIEDLNKRIDGLQAQYASLKNEISNLSRAESIDKPKIKVLENKKAEIREEIAGLQVKKEKTEATKVDVSQELMARQVREARYLRLSSIISNTTVKYDKISMLDKKTGKLLQRLTKNDTKWRHTTLKFYLEHEDLKQIIDERFQVKIVDADNHKILSYIEQNPSFPESSMDTKGASFQFDGNLVELSFYNNTVKSGKNYDLQIYYVDDDGKEYLLTNGARPLVMNRRVLNL